MNNSKNLKTTLSKSFVLLLLTTCVMSCDLFVENNDLEKEDKRAETEAIINNQEEAQLLVKLSEDNQDVIELCKALQVIKVESPILELAKSLVEVHLEIAEEFNEVANDELISIPNFSELEIEPKKITNKEAFKKQTLVKISSKINNQLSVLKKLSDSTNNVEFKVLAVRANLKLKDNLNKTKQLISNLEKIQPSTIKNYKENTVVIAATSSN